MTAAVTTRADYLNGRARLAAELYATGLSTYEVAERLGVAQMTVVRDLRREKVVTRRACPHGPQRRRLAPLEPVTERVAVEEWPVAAAAPPAAAAEPARPIEVDLAAPAIAFSADRGWHITNVPPVWALEMLADLS